MFTAVRGVKSARCSGRVIGGTCAAAGKVVGAAVSGGDVGAVLGEDVKLRLGGAGRLAFGVASSEHEPVIPGEGRDDSLGC